jgi:hypothetical protein
VVAVIRPCAAVPCVEAGPIALQAVDQPAISIGGIEGAKRRDVRREGYASGDAFAEDLRLSGSQGFAVRCTIEVENTNDPSVYENAVYDLNLKASGCFTGPLQPLVLLKNNDPLANLNPPAEISGCASLK